MFKKPIENSLIAELAILLLCQVIMKNFAVVHGKITNAKLCAYNLSDLDVSQSIQRTGS